jgi:hypothetical protein
MVTTHAALVPESELVDENRSSDPPVKGDIDRGDVGEIEIGTHRHERRRSSQVWSTRSDSKSQP